MIYLVTKQQRFFKSDAYQIMDKETALEMILKHDWIEYDSETEGLDPYTKALLCVQFGLGEDQIVVDTTTIDVEYFRPVFENDKITLLGWNLTFDLKFLYHHRIIPTNVWDGMIAEKLLFLGYPAQFHSLSLQSAASEYLKMDLDKSIRGKIVNTGLTEDVIVYAAHDVMYLTRIKELQTESLIKKDLLRAVEFENNFVPVIAYIEYCGAKIDVDKWKVKMNKDIEVMQEAKTKINKWVEQYYMENQMIHPDPNLKHRPFIRTSIITSPKKESKDLLNIPASAFGLKRKSLEDGKIEYSYGMPFDFVERNLQGDLFSGFDNEYKCTINWDSNKQVVPLFETLGINCTTVDKKTKQKTKSVGIPQIEPQAYKCTIIEPYIEYKKMGQQVKSFGQKFLNLINPVSGRIHANFYQLGTDTGRLSSSDPNLQNLPHDKLTRSCFIAEKGNKWISVDYSGQESFLMASIANDKAMLDELINGSKDMHSLTAKMVFKNKIPQDMPTAQVKKAFPELRQEAKGYEFCFNYAGNASTLQRNYGLDAKRAREIENNYMNGFSGLKAYQERQKEFVVKNGYILLSPVTGHKAFIYDWDNLNRINNDLGTIDGQYVLQHRIEEDPLFQEADFLRRRISESMKQSVNYPIQGAGALCFKLASIKLFNWLKSNNLLFKVKYCIPVHDEINLEAPEEIADEVAKILVKCMESGGKPFCTRAPLTADISIGDHWIH